MSILLIRSLNKCHQINSILKLTSRSLGISPIIQQRQKLRNDEITTSNDRTDVSTDVRPLGERIKENTKTASYFGVIVFGIGVTGYHVCCIQRVIFFHQPEQCLLRSTNCVC